MSISCRKRRNSAPTPYWKTESGKAMSNTSEEPIDDRIVPETAAKLLGGERPMACCPRDGEPLISTIRWRGAEFFCMICRQKFGFLSPVPKEKTQALEDRYQELLALFTQEFETSA